MCAYTYTHIHIHTYTHTHTHVHTCIHTHIYTYTHTYKASFAKQSKQTLALSGCARLRVMDPSSKASARQADSPPTPVQVGVTDHRSSL